MREVSAISDDAFAIAVESAARRRELENATELRIRAAALALFARRGFAATGIRDIVKAAGITNAALYHYVGTKDELLVDMTTDALVAINQFAIEVLEETPEPASRLVHLTSGHIALHALNPLSSQVTDLELRAIRGEERRTVVDLRDRYEGVWQEILLAGRDQGVFDFEDLRLTRLALLDMCTGIWRWYNATGPTPLRAVCGRFADLALASVGAHRGGEPIKAAQLELWPLDRVPVLDREPAESDRREA